MHAPLSYISPSAHSAWGTYLLQVDRVLPYLGSLSRWSERSSTPSGR
jgi:glutamate dehydrogenase (NAD(P)+)